MPGHAPFDQFTVLSGRLSRCSPSTVAVISRQTAAGVRTNPTKPSSNAAAPASSPLSRYSSCLGFLAACDSSGRLAELIRIRAAQYRIARASDGGPFGSTDPGRGVVAQYHHGPDGKRNRLESTLLRLSERRGGEMRPPIRPIGPLFTKFAPRWMTPMQAGQHPTQGRRVGASGRRSGTPARQARAGTASRPLRLSRRA
jgi:hypothetical protein